MKTFMMTTAIVAVTSFGAFAQTAGTTAAPATQAQTGQMAQLDQQHMVPAFLASDFIGKNVYTLDDEGARQVRDQRLGMRDGVQPGVAQPGVAQPGVAQPGVAQPGVAQPGVTQQADHQQRVQRIQQDVQHLQQAGVDQQQVQQLEMEVQQLQQQVQQLPAQPDQAQIQQIDQQVQQVEMQVQQLQQQAGVQPAAQPGAQVGVHPQAQVRHRGAWDQTRMRWETGDTFMAARDRWNNVGDIDDIVMTADGEIRGILIDVGGFLGIGARTVMVDLDELHFVLDHQNGTGWFDDTADDFFIVAAMTEAELEALPEWDEANLRRGFEARPYADRLHEPGATMGHDATVAEREGRVVTQDTAAVQQQPAQPATVRTQQPAGYQAVAYEQLTVDTLQGADVYDAQNQQIGNVEDLILAADGTTIDAIVLDIGGFLGIGQHRVALQIQEVDIFQDQQQQVRVQVPMTQEQLEQLPEYRT